MEDQLYNYRAKVISVYDGDTIRVDIDLGLKTWVKNEPLRFARIDAPEVRGSDKEKGKASRDFLRSKIMDHDIIVETMRDEKGKYGRYIAEIWLKEEDDYTNINDLLVEEGHAIYKEY